MDAVFHEGQSFIRDVEKDDCCAKHSGMVEHIDVEGVCDADQNEDQHLAADALEADRRGELLIGDGAHDAGDTGKYGLKTLVDVFSPTRPLRPSVTSAAF